MASFSPPASPLEERQDHDGDADREATEMGDYDEVLRRSHVYINSSANGSRASNATPNRVYVPSMRRSVAKLWQRQVSPTVPHNACRDHLGTPILSLTRLAAR